MITDNEQLRKIFVACGSYVGHALYVARAPGNKTTIKLARDLRCQFPDDWKDATAGYLERVESGKYEISFEKFLQICAALDQFPGKVLMAAQVIQRNAEHDRRQEELKKAASKKVAV